ncbi:MAG: GNAT family N-acetyltransferase [Candidatus Lokiarchaeota archaeon]|nr:GNAT family N-acetyltransferase [Candidatus Lokiarchaeota archaeon]
MTLFDNLYPINKKQLKEVSLVLADAFSEDEMFKIMKFKIEEIALIYEILTRICLRYGNVYLTSKNLEGIIGFTPGNKHATLWRTIRSGAIFPGLKLMKLFGREMRKIMQVIEKERKELNIGPYIYFSVIGVSQKNQGEGYGGKLIKALIEKADIEGKPIYLETQNEPNVKMYEKFGFEILKKIDMSAIDFDIDIEKYDFMEDISKLNPHLWLMLRKCN